MTEIEKIEYTKAFIDKMAQGINPLTDAPAPENDLINNVRISRCFFYVSDLLRQVIENGGVAKAPKKRASKPFTLTPEQIAAYRASSNSLSLSQFAKDVTALAGDENMQKLTYYDFMDWLVSRGLINETIGPDGKPQRLPSEDGTKIGIRTEHRQTPYGDRDFVVYDANAQQFLLDNVFAVIEMKNREE